MFTLESRPTIVLSTPLSIHFLGCTMTDVSVIALDQLLCQLIQSIKVVAGMSSFVWLEAQPLNDVPDCSDVSFLLRLRVCIIISQVTFTSMVLSVSEVHSDGLAVSNMQISIGFWRKSSKHSPTSCLEMFLHPRRNDLLVSTRLVQTSQEPFQEHLVL